MLKPPAPKPEKQAQSAEQVQVADAAAPATEAASDDQKSLVDQVEKTVQTITNQPVAASAEFSALPVLHAVPAEKAIPSTLGSLDKTSDDKLEVQLTGWGAGLWKIQLTDYDKDLHREEHYMVREAVADPINEGAYHFPFAARSITINSQTIKLVDKRWNLDPAMPGRYTLDLADETDKALVTLVRQYSLDGYQINCAQSIINHTNIQLSVVWNQYGIADITPDKVSYMGDRREFATGYFDPEYDSQRRFIYANKGFVPRKKLTDNILENNQARAEGKPVEASVFWPTPKAPQSAQMVWTASVNRYFALAMYRPLVTQPTEVANGKAQSLLGPDGVFASVTPQLIGIPNPDHNALDTSVVMLNMVSKPITIKPNASADLDMSLYAGPRLKDVLTQQPFASLSLDETIRYELGCTWFTFQWLARGLLNFLRFLHGIIWDWGISIVILVLVVRALLHPITKKSQIQMTKMGKQMQAIQPEIQKLKEKYANDQQKFQQEQMKLFREKNVNPANMLGCAPMFLQTPIWIALYAMLYFAIELRHESAFYGIFQTISGGSWHFLADLSAPDNFIKFSGTGFSIPLVFINFHMTGINILPILMGVMFFLQQKFTMPPAANEQAAQQQKMMKFMTLLFPFFLYSAPSGLTLYILSSTTAGMIDSYFVRKHIKEQEASGELFKAKPRKEGGLRDRMGKYLQKRMEEAQRMQSQHEQKKKRK
jgi:YidC/Oxa1 family membrane protein insertase